MSCVCNLISVESYPKYSLSTYLESIDLSTKGQIAYLPGGALNEMTVVLRGLKGIIATYFEAS